MAISTQYFDDVSYVKLSGNLTANEVLGNVIKYNKGAEFRQIKARIVDGRELVNVNFLKSDMKVFVAVDKSSFINNEELLILMVSNDPTFVALFSEYSELMAASPWQFKIVESITEALAECNQRGFNVHSLAQFIDEQQEAS